jgi:hypothetical protein
LKDVVTGNRVLYLGFILNFGTLKLPFIIIWLPKFHEKSALILYAPQNSVAFFSAFQSFSLFGFMEF